MPVLVIVDLRNHCNRCFIRSENQPLVLYFDLLKFLKEIYKNLFYDLKMKKEAINKKKAIRTALGNLTERLLQDAVEIISYKELNNTEKI